MRLIRFHRSDSEGVLRLAILFPRAGLFFGVAWAKPRGERWYRKEPGDTPIVWASRGLYEGVVVYNLFLGRLVVGVGIRQKEAGPSS